MRPSFSGLLAHVPETDSRTQWKKIHTAVTRGEAHTMRVLRLAPDTSPVLYCGPRSVNEQLVQSGVEDNRDVLEGTANQPRRYMNTCSGEVSQWQRFDALSLPTVPLPIPDNHVRLVCVSDTHTAHDVLSPLPPGDILVHAGDFTDVGKPEDIESFCVWLKKQTQFKHRLVIAGNHDLSLDEESYKDRNWKRFGHKKAYDTKSLVAMLKDSCTYLDHESTELEGLRIFGSPYQPEFFDWGFNLSRRGQCFEKWKTMVPFAEEMEDQEASAEADGAATKAKRRKPFDILLTHGPPMGHGDVCLPHGGHEGCADLLDFIEKYEPKVHIFGHIHENWGATVNKANRSTLCVNASTMDQQYDSLQPQMPIVVDVPRGHPVLGKDETLW